MRSFNSWVFAAILTTAMLRVTSGAQAQGSAQMHVLYVADRDDNSIKTVAADGTVSVFASGGSLNHPYDLAFDRLGDLYVSNVGSYYTGTTISKITPDGTISTVADGLQGPLGIAFDTAGNLFVATENDDSIHKITPSGVMSTFATGINATFLAFDSQGVLYVSTGGENTIYKFMQDGTRSLFVNSGVDVPHGLTFDASHNLYVANYGGSSASANSISRITPGGTASTFVSGITTPVALVFDEARNLYVDNWNFTGGTNSELKKIAPDGTITTFVPRGGGLNSPVGLAFGPRPASVPEPTAWALFAAGLIPCITVALRRRR